MSGPGVGPERIADARDQLRLLNTALDPQKAPGHRLAALRELRIRHDVPFSQHDYLAAVTPRQPMHPDSHLYRAAAAAPINTPAGHRLLTQAKRENPAAFKGHFPNPLKSWEQLITRDLPSLFRPSGSSTAGRIASGQEAAGVPTNVITGLGRVAGATVTHPGQVLSATGRSIPATLEGLAAAPVFAALDPHGALRALKKDFNQRYGPQAGKEARRQGLLPYALDIAALAAPVGRVAGGAARSGAFGERVGRLASEPRPDLRVAPGVIRTQQAAPNLFVRGGQHAIDTARRRAQSKRVRQAEEGGARMRPTDAVRPYTGPPEVVPLTKRGAQKLERQRYSKTRGQGTVEMRQAINEEVNSVQREAHKRLTKDQLNRGALRYAIEHGVRSQRDWEHVSPQLRRIITTMRGHAERGALEGHGGKPVDIPKLRQDTNDELRAIDYLDQHPEVWNQHLGDVADKAVQTGGRLAALDPAFSEAAAEERRLTPQMLALGHEARRGGVLNPADEAGLRSDQLLNKRQYRHGQIETQVNGKVVKQSLHEFVRDPEALARTDTVTFPPSVAEVGAAGSHRLMDATLQEVDQRLKAAGFRPTKKVDKSVEYRRTAAARAPTLGPESIAEFAARAQGAREAAGLAEPGYFPHERAFRPVLSDYTHGSGGMGAIRGVHQTNYDLMQHGVADVRAAPLFQKWAENIKRHYSWNFAIKNGEELTVPYLRRLDTGEILNTRNRSIGELVDAMDHAGIDERQVVFWNPKKMRADGAHIEGDVGDLKAGDLVTHEEAFRDSTLTPDRARRLSGPADFKGASGWHLLSKPVHEEMAASFKYQGLAGRLMRKYGIGIPARIILGLNPSWEVIQVISNASLAALAGVHPVDWAAAHRFFKANPDILKTLEPHIGATSFTVEQHIPKVGAAAPNWALIKYWQALKETPMMSKAAGANPLDLLFRADHAQNNFFRKAVAYNQLKREAYAGMRAGARGLQEDLPKVEGIFSRNPQEALRAAARNPEALERIGDHVEQVLGNYSTYTAKERKYLQQNVMFYGWLRFSLRFALWTLPTKHPVATALLGHLSKLNGDEVRRLLGAKPGDPLPFGALNNYYSVKNGKLQVVGLQRLNPAMNQVTQFFNSATGGLRSPTQILGVTSPLIQEVANQIFAQNIYFQKPWKVGGKSTPIDLSVQRALGFGAVSPRTRARIALEDLLQQAAPYRLAEQYRFRGQPQGADTLLFSPRPTHYKSPATVKSIRKSVKQERARSPWDVLLGSQLPFLPHVTQDREITKSLIQERNAALQSVGRGKPKHKKVKSPFGGGGGFKFSGGGF